MLLTARVQQEGAAALAVRRYFDAWNARDMASACNQFAADCAYEDTLYPDPFTGKPALVAHLNKCADALPPSFQFCIDEVADGGDTVGIQWHVESNGNALPFTRGCSLYKADPKTGKLLSGFDVPEPTLKAGSASLLLLGLVSKLLAEPIRAIPLLTWGAYVIIVFFSDGILPGPSALQLDPSTWEEVRDLSLNFWLVSPLLDLPFAPVLHPSLEGMFNLLLAWAAAFAGFLSDGRPGRSSGSMLPTIAGMQLLTNAVLLPYLVFRAPEDFEKEGGAVFREDLAPIEALIGESRVLPPVLTLVGTTSILWGLFARPEFGDIATRWYSFCELLGADRLGSSFVVDLVLFALFQGWLVDDDLSRRGLRPNDARGLAAKFVPFFGLCAYLATRPELPTREKSDDE